MDYRRQVAMRRDGDDFVIALEPDGVVVFRNKDADAMRKVCRSLRWQIVRDAVIGEDMANDDVANDGMAGDDTAGEDVAGDDIAGEEIAGGEIVSEASAVHSIAGEDIASDTIGDETALAADDLAWPLVPAEAEAEAD